MESLLNKFNSTFSQPNYKQTSAYFTSKITNVVKDEVSDCIGLDFGNSNICVSYFKNQLFHVFQLGTQSCNMPAWLTLKEQEFFIGTAAKNTQNQKSTKLTVFDIRRVLSLNSIPTLDPPYQLTKEMAFERNNVSIPLVRVIAIIFAAIKTKVEKTLKEEIKSVVLTIPTSFDIKKQQLLVDACQIANLKVIKLLFEPVATAITYYSLKKHEKKTVCVIDFGGGKLDVANFLIDDGRIELLNHATDLQLGGIDFDEKLVFYVINMLKSKYPSINSKQNFVSGIREKCVILKESLTTCTQKSNEFEIGDDDITINITRSEFETLCDDLFRRAQSLINSVANQIDKLQLHDVILIGGSTRMPKFQSDIQQIFPNIPFNVTINADEAIAKGACMFGALKCGLIKKFNVEDKIPWKKELLQNPKIKTFVDCNGIVQQKVVESSTNHNTDIKSEQNEIKKMFEKHDEISKREYQDAAKFDNVDDGTTELVEKYMSSEFTKNYEQQGYDIVALKAFKHYLSQNFDPEARAQVVSYFVQRIEICLKAIHLYQSWVPVRVSQCGILDHEAKKLCLNSGSMDPYVLETHQQYLNLVRFFLEKRYEIYPFCNRSFSEPCKSLLEKIKTELNILRNQLENFHRTNQRVVYDIQMLTELLLHFFQQNRRGQ